MKKKSLLALTLLSAGLLFSFVTFNHVTNQEIITTTASEDRYANIDTSTPEKLFASCRTAANNGWKQCSYSNLTAKLQTVDYDTEGLDDPSRPNRMVDIYSATTNFKKTDNGGNYSKEGDMWNREHLIPKSWWGGNEGGPAGEGGDAFNMFPTDGYVNNRRSNYPLGEVSNPTYTSNQGFNKLGPNTFAGYSGTAFEINDKYKGDVARAYFYFVTKFSKAPTYTSGNGTYVFTSSKSDTNFGLTDYAKSLFYKWHKLDPVSTWEMKRCDNIELQQGNRNPFIDHPEYVDYIWGATEPEQIKVTGVSLNKTSTSIMATTSEKLVATISPSNASDKTVTWSSSDSSIATVSSDGTVKGIKEGKVTITVTTKDGSFTSTCEVNVTPKEDIHVTGVTLNKSSLKIEKGKIGALSANIIPSNADDKSVTWSSEDESIATVNNGTVTGVSVGETTVSVTTKDGGFKASATIVVSEEIVHVTGINLNKGTLTLEEGQEETLIATVIPSNASDKSVLFSSDDNWVCEVDNEGKLTALEVGEATITVMTEDGNFTANCVVKVVEPVINVTSVNLDITSTSLFVKDTKNLTATVLPGNASDKTISWSSSDPSVCKVEDGKITALKAGNATITVTTTDGNKTATCTVEVKEYIPVTSISVNKTELTLKVNDTYTLTVSVNPTNATNPKVTFISMNENVATIDENGKITAKSSGVSNIMITSEDGPLVTCKVIVGNAKSGCGGSIVASSAIISTMSLLGASLLIIKRRKK